MYDWLGNEARGKTTTNLEFTHFANGDIYDAYTDNDSRQ